MSDDASRTGVECQGAMSPIIIMDEGHYGNLGPGPQQLQYCLPDDKRSLWTGTYPTAGPVQAFMCSGRGRIALYASAPATA